MRTFVLGIAVILLTHFSASAQLQTPDAEGAVQAASLKKLSKKAKFGASSIEKTIHFSTAKGIQGTPVVTATEEGKVEMASIQAKALMMYMLYSNQFMKVSKYDFQIFYGNGFRSQRYSPFKVSMTGDDVYFDDSYGEVYGLKADAEGQRCRFLYDYQYADAKYLTRVYFHESYPVKKNTVSFTVPSWLTLDIQEENFQGYKIKKDVKKEKNQTTYTYTAEDLPGIKQEDASLAWPYFLPHLVITVRSYTVNQKTYNGFKTLGDLYAWMDYLYKKCNNTPKTLEAQVKQLTASKTTDEEKIKAIYYWVQDNIRYIAFENGYAGFVPMTVQDVYKNKYGDCKGMANLMTEMLKLAGYDAHFAWIGTKDIPYDFANIQSICVANHAICVLYLKGQTYFLDGTEKYAPMGVNAYRIQGKSVLVENGDSYKLDTVPAARVEDNLVVTHANLKLQGDSITGHVTLTFSGESKNFFHYIYHNIPTDKRKDFIDHMVALNNPNTEVNAVSTSDFKNRDIPIVIQGNISIYNQVTQVDSTCYTGIDFFPSSITQFIPGEERQTPIDIGNLMLSKDSISLELPKGSKARWLPKPFDASFQGDSIHATYNMVGHTILLTKETQFGSPVIKPTDFANWKDFLDKVKTFNRNNISVNL
jgi:transglutaminase-like putative cysteine protease